MKELKEQIIEALQDAIDTETGQVSISYFDALLDNVLTEALRIHDVVGRSEQLTAFNEWLDDNHHSFKIPDMILNDYIRYGG